MLGSGVRGSLAPEPRSSPTDCPFDEAEAIGETDRVRGLASAILSPGGRFEVTPAGHLVYKPFFGGPKISSVQPIYRSGTKLVEGERYGTVNGPETTAVARTGYAVGALRTHAGLGLDGFEMIFMKIKGERLDPADSYNSPWLGDVNGGNPGEVLNDGSLVVGLQGRASGSVRALGPIVVR